MDKKFSKNLIKIIGIFIISSLFLQMIVGIVIYYVDDYHYRLYTSFWNYLQTGALDQLIENIGLHLIASTFFLIGMIIFYFAGDKINGLRNKLLLRIIFSIVLSIITYPIFVIFLGLIVSLIFFLVSK